MVLKITQTPAEDANTVQGRILFDNLRTFVKNEAAISTSAVLASKVIRENLAVVEVVCHIVDPGDGGTGSFTKILVKKNGTSILAADAIKVEDDAAADTIVIALPDSDAHASLKAGDLLTIESGDDIGDVMVGTSVEVRLAKRYSEPAA